MFCIFAVAFMAMGARLFTLQVLERPTYARLATQQRQHVITFPPQRGSIFDRNGQPLAISINAQMVYADPLLVKDAHGESLKLAPVLGLKETDVESALRGSSPLSQFQYVARQVDPAIAAKVKALHLQGVYLRPEPKRYYPGGRLGSQILGFTNIDGAGLTGIELRYDKMLVGEPGTMTLQEDPSGRPLPQAPFTETQARPGTSLFLTIDKQLQYFTELTLAAAVRQFHAHSGTAIVMRPSTGEVLAMANVPTFDDNNPTKSPVADQKNAAVTDVYEPGSAFKLVTASAALQTGMFTPKSKEMVPDQLQVSDRTIHDAELHPTEQLSLKQVITQSSNVGTVEFAQKLGSKVINSFIHRFGFGAPTGIDYPGESPGIVIPRSQWSGSSIANIPIGQGVAVTPLQLITAYAALANHGTWVQPKLLDSVLRSNGKPAASPASATRRVVSAKTAAQMTKILESVVQKGTGIEAQIPGYAVAGKTGTAQKVLPTGGYGSEHEGTFVGFAPANDPQLAVLVKFDNPSPFWGGTSAAPTFQTIMQFALRHFGVPPSSNAAKAAKAIETSQTGSVPSSGY